MKFYVIQVGQQLVHEASKPNASPLLTARFNVAMRFSDEASARAYADLVSARVELDRSLRCVRVWNCDITKSEPIVASVDAKSRLRS